MTLTTPLPRGRFIALEGVDGSGKTTQLQALVDWLPTSGLMPQGARLITTRAPGGTVLGQALRGLLLHPPSGAEPCPIAGLMLYAADISQLTAQIIEPALAAGNWVLCDRYTGSTMAYQGYGRGLDLALIKQLNQMATSGLEPDLTLWLNLPLTDSLRRRGHRLADRIESVGGTFLDRVVQGYCQLWSANGWSAIDASQGMEAVTAACQIALMVAFPARAVLATEPVEEGPSDEELDELAWNLYSKTGSTRWQIEAFRAFARAALARWGHPAASPVPEVGDVGEGS